MVKLKDVMSFLIASAVLGISVSYSNIYLFHIAVFILMFYIIISVLKNNLTFTIPILPRKYHRFFVVMILWYSFSILWSFDRTYSIQYVLYILMGSFLSMSIIYFSTIIEKLNHVFKVLGIFFIFEVFISLLEALTPFRLPNSPLSKYLSYFGKTHEPNTYLESMPTGFQWNPNSLATAMSIIYPYFLLHKSKKVKIIGIVSVFSVVFFTQSRGNMLTLCLITLLYIYFINLRRALIFSTIIPVFGLILFFIFSPFLSNVDNPLINKVNSSYKALEIYLTSDERQGDSLGIRRTLLDNGFEKLIETKGLGVGGGSTRSHLVNGISEGLPLHNFWAEVLVESGILFFLVFALWYVSILYNLYIARKSESERLRYYANSSFLSLLCFVAGAISSSSTIYFLPMWILFGFSISIINIYKLEKINVVSTSKY